MGKMALTGVIAWREHACASFGDLIRDGTHIAALVPVSVSRLRMLCMGTVGVPT